MTRTIDSALLTAQKRTAYKSTIQAQFHDNGLPHPTVQIPYPMSGWSGVNAAACLDTDHNVIVRARRYGGDIYTQRVTDPTSDTQWAAWSSTVSSKVYPSVFSANGYVVLTYQDPGYTVQWRRSSNGGQTWSTQSDIWSPAYYLNGNQIGVSAPNTASRAGLFYANGNYVAFKRYSEGTDSWYGVQQYNAGAALESIGACYNQDDDTYYIAYVVADYESWATHSIVLQTLHYDGGWVWSTPRVYLGLQGGTDTAPAYSFNAVNLAHINDTFWLSFVLVANDDYGALADRTDTVMAWSTDGTHFTGGVKLGQTSLVDRLMPLAWSSDMVYIPSDSVLLRSPVPATVTTTQEQVTAYDLRFEGPRAYLTLEIDNRDGTYDTLPTGRLGTDLTFKRGADGYTVDLGRFVIDRFTRKQDGASLALHALGYYNLLDLWAADFLYYFQSITLRDLVRSIAALAGIPTTTDDDNAIWTKTISEFLITPGQSAAAALEVLQQQYQFVSRMNGSYTLYSFMLSTTPSADYTFGQAAGEHPSMFIEDQADRSLPKITHAVVIGDAVGGEALATDLIAESGRQFTRRVERLFVSNATDAAATAQAIIDKAETAAEQAKIVCLPVFHLQPFDVVSHNDWATNTLRYISEIREIYNPLRKTTYQQRSRMAWRQTLTLAAITPMASSAAGLDVVIPESLARPTMVRGRLVSFNTSTWTGLVRLSGSTGSVSLPVADFATQAYLVAGQDVAVLLFDPTNPTDGMIVGSYAYAGDLDRRDFYPYDDRRGLAMRFITPAGSNVTDHFRSGNKPTGYTWQGSPFNGTPTRLDYCAEGEYMRVTALSAGAKHFLSAPVDSSGYTWRYGWIYARLTSSHQMSLGLRADDGSNAEYAEIYLDATSNDGMQTLTFRYLVAGGSVVTVASNVVIPAGQMLTITLRCYYTTNPERYRLYGYLWKEDNSQSNIVGFSTPALVNIPTTGRAGILVEDYGSQGAVDWFLNTFS